MKFSKRLKIIVLTLILTPISTPLIGANQLTSSRQAFIKGLINTRNVSIGVAAGLIDFALPILLIPGAKKASWVRHLIIGCVLLRAVTIGIEEALEEPSGRTDSTHKKALCLGHAISTGAVAAATLFAIKVTLDKILPYLRS